MPCHHAHGLGLCGAKVFCHESVVAHDILTTPSIVTSIDEGPRYQGFYNQMKQEYVFGTVPPYEALTVREAHYSDREVFLFDTHDYASYGLAAEKLKMAFRTFYSLLDKTGFFVNAYFALGIAEGAVNFRTPASKFCHFVKTVQAIQLDKISTKRVRLFHRNEATKPISFSMAKSHNQGFRRKTTTDIFTIMA